MDEKPAGDGPREAGFRKAEIRRPLRRGSVPARPRGARLRYEDRRLVRLRRTFGRPDLVVKSWGASLAPWRLCAVGVLIVLRAPVLPTSAVEVTDGRPTAPPPPLTGLKARPRCR